MATVRSSISRVASLTTRRMPCASSMSSLSWCRPLACQSSIHPQAYYQSSKRVMSHRTLASEMHGTTILCVRKGDHVVCIHARVCSA
jgi:aconitase B